MKKIICKSNLDNVKRFVEQFAPSAPAVEAKTGIQAVAMLAQVAQETGWGGHILNVNYNGVQTDSKNLFNIKAGNSWNGKRGVRNVWEVDRGKRVWLDQWFRMYDRYEIS